MASLTRKPFSKTNLVVFAPITPLEHAIDIIATNAFSNDLIYDPSCHPMVVNA
jgi:hypothetical protein